MGDALELGSDLMDGLSSLASVVNFLFSGLTFGLIPSVRDIEDETDNILFTFILSRASQSLYALYLIVVLIVTMYNAYNSVYNIIITSVALLVAFWIIYLMKKKKKDEEDDEGLTGFAYFLYWSGTLILCVRLLVNTYYLIVNILNGNHSAEYEFQIVQLSGDLFFLLLFTLALYLPLIIVDDKNKTKGKSLLTVWAMEYGDIIAHLIVCLLYAPSISQDASVSEYAVTEAPANSQSFGDVYLTVYFIIYCVNVSLFCLPLPWVSNFAATYHPMIIHTMGLDFVTDLPFTIVTLAGETYVGNIFITIDVVINIITLIRGLIWVPVEFKTADLEPTKIGKYVCIGFAYLLAGSTALSVAFGPGVWLLVHAFDDPGDCHRGTEVFVDWNIWFHIAGWAYFGCMLPLFVSLYQFYEEKDDAHGAAWVVGCCGTIFYFILGAIGCAMYDQTTSACRFTHKGVTLLVYSVFYMVVGPLILCAVTAYGI
eukprot:134125_1